jgi:hypothetical protein
MSNYKEGNLEIQLALGAKNQMTWIGKSDERDPSAVLNPYFDEIIEKLTGKELGIDFSKLEYINSSTVPPIIQLIKNLNAKSIKTKITYNKNSKWQAASFKALETIVRTMNNIEVMGI